MMGGKGQTNIMKPPLVSPPINDENIISIAPKKLNVKPYMNNLTPKLTSLVTTPLSRNVGYVSLSLSLLEHSIHSSSYGS